MKVLLIQPPVLFRRFIDCGCGDYRAYYRIVNDRVVVLAILHKKDSEGWLGRFYNCCGRVQL